MSVINPLIIGESCDLGTKSVTENGTYTATDDGYDGYSEVNVNVSGGGETLPAWQDPDWYDIKAEFLADTETYTYKAFALIAAKDDSTNLYAQASHTMTYITSDGSTYTNKTANTAHTWDKSQDLTDSLGANYRWIKMYSNDSWDKTPSYNSSCIWVVYNMSEKLTGATATSTVSPYSNNKVLKRFETMGLVTELGDYALYNCTGLISFESANNLITNGKGSLLNTGLEISTNLLNTGEDMWKNSARLKYVKINDTTGTYVDSLYGCEVLQSVELPNGFNSDNFNVSASTLFGQANLYNMILKFYDRSALSAYAFIMGATNLAKLTASQIAVATNNNWTLS